MHPRPHSDPIGPARRRGAAFKHLALTLLACGLTACAQTPRARIDTQACEPGWQQAQRSNQTFVSAGLAMTKDIGLASACPRGGGPIPIRTDLRSPGEREALLRAMAATLDGMQATPEERGQLLKPLPPAK